MHYKLNQADKANEIFETLHTQHPSNEITAYFIITKLKLNDVMSASKLYNELCFRENKAIQLILKLSILSKPLTAVFLQSIPVERPNLDAAETLVQDITNSNYKSAIENLPLKHKQPAAAAAKKTFKN